MTNGNLFHDFMQKSLPQLIHAPIHVVSGSHLLICSMISSPVILESYGADLITSHATANLLALDGTLCLMLTCAISFVDSISHLS
jgi:hypothetical protein